MNEKISKNTLVVLVAIIVAIFAVLFYKNYNHNLSNTSKISVSDKPNTLEENKSIDNTDKKIVYEQGIEGSLSKTTIPGVHLGPIENIDGTVSQPQNDQSITVFLTNTQVDVRQLPADMISRANNLTKDDLDNILKSQIFKSTTTDKNGFFKISTDPGWYLVTMHGQENITIPGGAPFVSVLVKQDLFSTVNLTLKIVMQ